jgi:predicted MFS family arabinose efflux permease
MTLSGLCASLIGIGLARFAYTPLLPELIAAHWFAPSQAAYLGAANLVGYLAGALLAQTIAARISVVTTLRAMMLVATAAFFACAIPLSFLWFFLWRFASGLSGGVLMVLVAPTVLPHVPPSRRGVVGGFIFVGIGCGIVISGTLVPALLQWSLVLTWCGLGIFALLLSVVAWNGWPHEKARPQQERAKSHRLGWPRNQALGTLYLEYALNAFGLVPHMIFLVDFVARELGQGLEVGARYWVLFGLGAMAGPVLAGYTADRIGFRLTLRIAFLVQAIAVGMLVVDTNPISLIVSSIIVGAFVPGIVPLVLGRVHELTFGDTKIQKTAWSLCTTAFALGQAGGAYGLSYIFARAGSAGSAYALLFAFGAAALAFAFTIEIVMAILGLGQNSMSSYAVQEKINAACE